MKLTKKSILDLFASKDVGIQKDDILKLDVCNRSFEIVLRHGRIAPFYIESASLFKWRCTATWEDRLLNGHGLAFKVY
jgi:hypothetical protein